MNATSKKKLTKAATKNRGKVTKARNVKWVNAFDLAIKADPCGNVIEESDDGRPVLVTRPYSKKNAWCVEMIDPKTGQWGFHILLNLDKQGSTIRLSHTIKWCMEKLKENIDYFEKGQFDKCNTRIRNQVTGDVVMAAVLI